ncbi:MAG: DNA polymerase Y family protein [Caldilineales bacterium]|nr:DNA polymerase Y family protein [Caldilineales bacterium]
MPIIACAIPYFPIALLARADPGILQQPVAMLNAEERVLATTPAARMAGVAVGQTVRQAQTLCPALVCQVADLALIRQEYEYVLALLDEFADAVEPASLGTAYIAAPDLDAASAAPFCQEMGKQLRQEFGEALQPAIGCDSGKFTALAAARHTRAGAVRVVLGEAETPFLRPLPIHLLPLAAEHLQLLHWLGIRTLGDFAALPTKSVMQQFGKAGRLAQLWAQGQDKRPVAPRHKRPIYTRSAEFEPAIQSLTPLAATAKRLLESLLVPLREQLQAAQGLRSVLRFEQGQEQADVWHLSAPTTDLDKLLQRLTHRWESAIWPAPVSGCSIDLSDIQEAPGDQLLLFPGAGTSAAHLVEGVQELVVRYGPGRFLLAETLDYNLLRMERRVRLQEFAA